MASVIERGGKIRTVKNVGWLVRHASEVSTIEVSPQNHFANPKEGFESRMIATLHDGTMFIADWGTTEVCREWIKNRQKMSRATVVFHC